jgi:predicted permease
VGDGFFSTLGVAPQLGRLPQPEEYQAGGDAVVVVSHGFWQRHFGGDPGALGRSLTLDGVPHTVVGVMPPSFTFPAERMDVWLSLSHIGEDAIPSRARQVRWMSVVARLKPGMTVEAAHRDMDAIARQLAAEYPDSNRQYGGATVLSLHEAVTGSVKVALLVLLGAVALLLLIACANVANLLLARATLRQRELAVRAALGASPARIAGQLLTESGVLAALGGALGLMLAVWGTRALAGVSLEQLPRLSEVRVDGAVLGFAVGAMLLTGLLFGALPALRAGSRRLAPVLKAGGGAVAAGGAGARSTLVVAEVALAVVLAAGAGLATRSLAWLLAVDAGFEPRGATVVSFHVPDTHEESYARYLAQVLTQVRAVPGVEVAALVKKLPLQGPGESVPVGIPGRPVARAGDLPRVNLMHVSTDSFRALRIPLLQGRAHLETDTEDAPPVLVANQAFARRFFPGEDAVGKTVLFGNEPLTLVGVVGDVRQASLTEPAEPTLYIHVQQNPRVSMNLVVRGHGAPLQLAAAVRQAIWSVDAQQTITRITTLEQVMGEAVTRPRLLAGLLGLFALLGLMLGAMGIYGVLAYTVSQRQRELGVRLALGARPQDVLRLVVRSGMALAGLGVALGVAGALGLGRLMTSVLYGVEPYDPLTFAGVALALMGVALAACLVPARRAMRVDPAVTLRAE